MLAANDFPSKMPSLDPNFCRKGLSLKSNSQHQKGGNPDETAYLEIACSMLGFRALL
jgi:hypothetical protein